MSNAFPAEGMDMSEPTAPRKNTLESRVKFKFKLGLRFIIGSLSTLEWHVYSITSLLFREMNASIVGSNEILLYEQLHYCLLPALTAVSGT